MFVDVTMAFDSIFKGKMEQIQLVYALPKETVTHIIMLYTKAMVRASDGDTNFFDTVADVFQGGT